MNNNYTHHLPSLIETGQLQSSYLDNCLSSNKMLLNVEYDWLIDALLITFTDGDVEYVVHYMDTDFALLYNPSSLEVLGYMLHGEALNFNTMAIYRSHR